MVLRVCVFMCVFECVCVYVCVCVVCVCVCDLLQPCSDRQVPGGKDEKDVTGREGKKKKKKKKKKKTTKEERGWRKD